MFGSEIVDVAIGMVLIYLLLSVLCSTLAELISRAFAMRSNNLADGVRNLLNDPGAEKLAKKLYEHPLIAKLSKSGKPSYIPSRTFALALFDIIAPADGNNVIELEKELEKLRDAVKNIEDENIRKPLQSLLNVADDLDKARQNVEIWFDDAMDRASGWYKRKSQLIILGLALVVSVILNADTFMVANSLSRDSTLRDLVVAAAVETTQGQPSPNSDTPLTNIIELNGELQQLGLPIGWLAPSDNIEDPREIPSDTAGWVYKILGLLVTTIAISQGAPFWFDVLNRIVNLRGAGKQPPKTSEKQRPGGNWVEFSMRD